MSSVSSVELGPPRGMRDFYPDQAAIQDHIFGVWTRAARRHGFMRYDACVVESLSLLTRKAGEEIIDQIYAFRDKSGRDLALRPEMTPTLARMVCARRQSVSWPVKWFAISQCFRYERASRGRKREHYQWNLDVLGAEGAAPEVEVLAAALGALADLGLAGAVRVHISNRALLAELLEQAAVPSARHEDLFLILDKRGKLSDEAIATLLKDGGFDDHAIGRIFDVFRLEALEEVGQALGSETPALQHTRSVFAGLADYGLQDQAIFDLGVVRGLNYYTGTVFEAFDTQRRFRAVFGGGRYDRLLETIGGQPAPAVGLGFGDVVVVELMQMLERLPSTPAAAEVLIGYMEPDQGSAALRAAGYYRRQGRNVDLAMAPEKARSFFGRAGSSGAAYALYIGPDDLRAGKLRLKHLESRTETVLDISAMEARES